MHVCCAGWQLAAPSVPLTCRVGVDSSGGGELARLLRDLDARAVFHGLLVKLGVGRTRREAARRLLASNGFARASTWRSLPHAPDRPKHAVVWVCEACSAVLSLMLLFAVADLASAQHRVASPPRVARVHMRAPQRTFEYDEPEPGLPLQAARAVNMPPTPTVAAVRPAAMAAARPAAPAPQRVDNGWVAARGVFALWLASFGVICLRAGTDDWAALALGIEPCVDGGAAVGATGGAAGGGAACKAGGAGFVQWEYDWERDAWREA